MREATDGTGAAFPDAGRPLEQASLVIDPPDGRIPLMKPEAIQRLVARRKHGRDAEKLIRIWTELRGSAASRERCRWR